MTLNMEKSTIIKFSLALNFILAIVICLGAIALSNVNSSIHNGQKQRRSFNAEQRFILCSRTGITDPSKEAEFEKTCAGYQTLAQSYKTEDNR